MSKRTEVKSYNDFIRQLLPALGSRDDIKDKERGIYSYIAYMLDRTQGMFEYTGLPETIPANMLELLLQVNGFAAVTKADGKLYAFFGGLGGVPDEYYRPTEVIINNPSLKFNKVCKIGTDAVVVRNDNMYAGLMPMFNKYAGLLVENDITFRVMSINSRISEIISASDDATAAAAREYLKQIEKGELGVIGEQTFFDGVKVQAGGESSRSRLVDLIEYNQYLKASWYNDIGLQANYNMKREALNSDEVQLNIKALLPLADDMLRCRKEGVQEINKLFGTDISVELAGVWKDTAEEVEQDNQLTGEEAPADPEQPAADPEPEAGSEEAGDNEER